MSDTIHIHIERECPVRVITVEPTGARGAAGTSATVTVGTTTTGAAGTNASVTNSGTTSAAVFNFTIPRGDTGATGATGATGPNSVTSATTSDGTATLSIANLLSSTATIGNSGSTSGQITIFSNGPVFQWYSDTVEYGERGFTFLTTNLTGERNYTLPNTSGTFAVTASTTGVPDKLTDGTIAGTTTFNSTSYTYGAGAAAAHRTALGVSASGDTVLKSAYTPAHSLLVQQSGTGSPSSLSVGNNTILGRASGGGSQIAALSGSDARTVLGLTTLATTTPAANVATFLETPTSANLAAAVTGETGTGALVFGTSPTIDAPTISGSAAFTSTTRPTSAGTGTPLSSSILSYSDFTNYIQQRVNTAILIPTFATSRTSSGGSLVQSRGYSELTLLVTNSAAINLQFDSCVLLQTTSASLSFDKRMIFCINIFEESLATNNQLFIQLGRNNFPATFSQLSEKGIGFGMSGSSLTPFVHNGSVLTSGSAVTKGTYSKIIMDFIPASGLYLYGLNNSTMAIDLLSSVTTNLPSGLENRAKGGLEIMHFNNGTGAAGKVTFSNPQFSFL